MSALWQTNVDCSELQSIHRRYQAALTFEAEGLREGLLCRRSTVCADAGVTTLLLMLSNHWQKQLDHSSVIAPVTACHNTVAWTWCELCTAMHMPTHIVHIDCPMNAGSMYLENSCATGSWPEQTLTIPCSSGCTCHCYEIACRSGWLTVLQCTGNRNTLTDQSLRAYIARLTLPHVLSNTTMLNLEIHAPQNTHQGAVKEK